MAGIVHLDWREYVAVVPETTYGVPATTIGATAFVLPMELASPELTFEQENIPHPDVTGSRWRTGNLQGQASSTGRLSVLLRGSGTPGAVPYTGLHDLLRYTHFADPNAQGSESTSGVGTQSTFIVAAPGTWAAGRFACVGQAGADPRLVMATGTSGGGPTTVTFWPPVPVAIGSGFEVGQTQTYAEQELRTRSLTLWRGRKGASDGEFVGVDGLPGWVPGDLTLTWDRERAYIVAAVEGAGSGQALRAGRTTLGAAIVDGVTTTITLTELGEVTPDSLIKVDSEHIEIVTKSADTGTGTCTVTRGVNGTAGAAHSNGATVYPALSDAPAITTSPVARAIRCRVTVGTVSGQIDVEATRVTVRVTDPIEVHHDAGPGNVRYGNTFTTGRHEDGAPTLEIEGYLTTANHALGLRGIFGLSTRALIQWDTARGQIFGVYAQDFYLDPAMQSVSGDGPVKVTLRGRLRSTTSTAIAPVVLGVA